jgi:hypothetical protein
LLYALYTGGTSDAAYRFLRDGYEKEAIERNSYHNELKRIMKEQNLWTGFQAKKFLENQKQESSMDLDSISESDA